MASEYKLNYTGTEVEEKLAKVDEIEIALESVDYTQLTNKPKINGVELNGDLTSEELGLNGVGGSIGKVRLIADITIDTANPPTNIIIDKDMDGNPFAVRKMIMFSDIQSTVSYTNFTINNAHGTRYALSMCHGKGWTFAEFSEDVMKSITNAKISVRIADEATLSTGGMAERKYFGLAKALNICSQYPYKSGTFLKVWEVLDA
jgi:hypothetical protein